MCFRLGLSVIFVVKNNSELIFFRHESTEILLDMTRRPTQHRMLSELKQGGGFTKINAWLEHVCKRLYSLTLFIDPSRS